MKDRANLDWPIAVADGVYWIGFQEEISRLRCNPYLIVEGNQAVLIDGGGRPDFAVVMMKILQTGISPKQIVALIYQHYDPDLCGSMQNVVDICDHPNLQILSASSNNAFLSYYLGRDKQHLLTSIPDHDGAFTFNGRTLNFFRTPYAHSSGSFITYDSKTKVLFTSDLFGSYSATWDLFQELAEECATCRDCKRCTARKIDCPIPDIENFHRTIMPCKKSLDYAMSVIRKLDVSIIAPQHGSVFTQQRDISLLIGKLEALDNVGIDAFYPKTILS